MYLQDIAPGQKVFIDANIFVYHFSKDSGFNKSCRDFLLKVESSEIHGFTSAAVILEATHRLMMVEATSIIESDIRNLPKYLKQNPEIAKKLTKHLAVPGKIASLNIEIVPVTLKAVEESQRFKAEYGFMSNDSLALLVMKELGLTALASNDSDFNRVEWLNIYLPAASL